MKNEKNQNRNIRSNMSEELIRKLQTINQTSSNSGQYIKLFENLKEILAWETGELDKITNINYDRNNYEDYIAIIDGLPDLQGDKKNNDKVKELIQIIKEMESSQSKTDKQYLKEILSVLSYFQFNSSNKEEQNKVLTYINNIIETNNNKDNSDQKFPFKEVKQVILKLYGELKGDIQNQFENAINKLTPDNAEKDFFNNDNSASYLANDLNDYVKNQKRTTEPENDSVESEDEKKALKLYCYLKNFHLLVKKDELKSFELVYEAEIEKKEMEGNPHVEKAKKAFQNAVLELPTDLQNSIPKQFGSMEMLAENKNLPEAHQNLIDKRNKLIVAIQLACNCKEIKEEMSRSIQSLQEKDNGSKKGGSLKTKRTIPKKRRVKQRKGCFKSTKKRRAKKKSFLYK